MKQHIIDHAAKNDVMSIYEYTIFRDETLPVFVAESVGDIFLTQMQVCKLDRSVIITMEDLMQGRDVFGVVLIHILARGKLVYGDDAIRAVRYEHEQIRTSLEAHLRHFLIDLREFILAGATLDDVYRKLMIVVDRTWCGLARYLNGKQILLADQVDEFVSDLDHDWHLELAHLRQSLVAKDSKISLTQVHHALLGLLHKIDTMEANAIK